MNPFSRRDHKPSPGESRPRRRRYVLEVDVMDSDERASDLILLYQDADLIFESDASKRRRERERGGRP